MLVLPLVDYERVRPLFEPFPLLFVDSILAGHTPAVVYVDDLAAPQTAVTRFQHRMVLAGAAFASSITAVRALLRQPAAENDLFVLHTTPEWQSLTPDILPGWQITSATSCYYRLDARQHEWAAAVSPGLVLRPVDAALLADPTIKNLDWVMEEMVSERPSVADFLDKSFGACLVHDGELVAWCMSEYNTGNRCELGIATAEAWQRQGLARLTATAVIMEALQRGIHDIGWVCWARNLPSVQTAEALGFTRTEERPVQIAHWANKNFPDQ
jgi:GNAT superfamily N-acetyltransferase